MAALTSLQVRRHHPRAWAKTECTRTRTRTRPSTCARRARRTRSAARSRTCPTTPSARAPRRRHAARRAAVAGEQAQQRPTQAARLRRGADELRANRGERRRDDEARGAGRAQHVRERADLLLPPGGLQARLDRVERVAGHARDERTHGRRGEGYMQWWWCVGHLQRRVDGVLCSAESLNQSVRCKTLAGSRNGL